jgi:D-psicose/D-tagatose/L-ribulose 3-epimerase
LRFGIITLVWCSPFTTKRLDVLERAARAGYDGVEIFLEREEELDYARVAAAAANAGVEISVCVQIDSSRDPSSDDRDRRRAGVEYLKRAIDAVREMGGTMIGGPVYGDQIFYGGSRPVAREARGIADLRARAVESLREVAEHAEAAGARVAVEPLNRFETSLVLRAEHAVDLVREVDSPAVGVQLDTYHMNIEEPDMPTAIEFAGERLIHFHANENNRGPIGSGHIDWDSIGAALARVGYDGSVVAEPFFRGDAGPGTNVALWIPPVDDESEDASARRSLAVLRERLGR